MSFSNLDVSIGRKITSTRIICAENIHIQWMSEEAVRYQCTNERIIIVNVNVAIEINT